MEKVYRWNDHLHELVGRLIKWILSIVFSLLPIPAIAAVIWKIASLVLGYQIEWFLPIIVSSAGWTIVYCFKGVYAHFWINPESDTAIILQNYFQSPPKEMKDAEVTGALFIPKGMTAVFTGVNPKLPWQRPVGEPIKLVDEVSRTDNTVATDKSRKRYIITFQVVMNPVRSKYLPRYLLVKTDTAAAFFLAKIRESIQAGFQTIDDGDSVMNKANREAFNRDYVESLFGGAGTISDDENRYARFTNTPFIMDIQRHPDDHNLAQIPTVVSEIAKGIDKLTTETGVQPQQAATLMMAAIGKNVAVEHLDINLQPPQSDGKGKKGKGGR